jgi:serine/threonine-protein kinase
VLDFGVAKAAMRSGATRDGQMKGKLSYMSPEQLNGREVDRRSDIFAAGVVLWEALAGKRLFAGADAGEILAKVLAADIPTPLAQVPSLPRELSDVVMRSLERDPEKRFQTARDFAIALEHAGTVATALTVGEWVKGYAGEEFARRQSMVQRVESHPVDLLSLAAVSGRDELTTKSESTSGVLVPVDSDVLNAERRPRGIVTLSLLVLGAAVGIVGGKELLFPERVAPPPVVAQPPSVPAPVETVVVVKEITKEVPAPPEGIEPKDLPTAEPSATVPKIIWPKTPRPERPPKPKDCEPPFTVDPVTGIRRPKPQCMK